MGLAIVKGFCNMIFKIKNYVTKMWLNRGSLSSFRALIWDSGVPHEQFTLSRDG